MANRKQGKRRQGAAKKQGSNGRPVRRTQEAAPSGSKGSTEGYYRKVLFCECRNGFDVLLQHRVAGMIVHERRTVKKGRKVTCTGCGTVHDLMQSGTMVPAHGFGDFTVPAAT